MFDAKIYTIILETTRLRQLYAYIESNSLQMNIAEKFDGIFIGLYIKENAEYPCHSALIFHPGGLTFNLRHLGA